MTFSEITVLTKDLILSAAAITGAVVAIKGLSTWKRQLRGQSEYELSRRILVTLCMYRDAVSGVRNPVMWAYEMPSPPEEEAKAMTREQVTFYGTSKAYQARWDKVQVERASLYADLLEGEAIWGDELKALFKVLFSLEHELFSSVRNYIERMNPDTDQESKKAIRDIEKKRRDIMYSSLGKGADEYRNDFQRGVEAIEKYLKPKLHY